MRIDRRAWLPEIVHFECPASTIETLVPVAMQKFQAAIRGTLHVSSARVSTPLVCAIAADGADHDSSTPAIPGL